jgi:hypothetical protein
LLETTGSKQETARCCRDKGSTCTTKETLLMRKHKKKSGDDPPPVLHDAEDNEEVIDNLTELLAALSQNDSDAYLESFESDDDESCSSDLDDFDNYGSE